MGITRTAVVRSNVTETALNEAVALELIGQAGLTTEEATGDYSYLHYDEGTGLFTVVSWDQNLSFGVRNAPGGAAAGKPSVGGAAPDPRAAGPGEHGGPPADGGAAFGGTAAEILDTWTSVPEEQAADLVPVETIESESASIAAYLD